MAGTQAGGIKAASSNKSKHGDDFYRRIGAKGGKTPSTKPKGFAVDDRNFIERLFRRPKRASRAGRKGGAISRRTK